MDLNVRLETIELLEENMCRTLFDIRLSNVFFYLSQARQRKAKINKWVYIKLKNLVKEITNKMKNWSIEWGKISLCSITQSCPTLWPPQIIAHQAPLSMELRTLEWPAIPFSGGSSQSRDWTHISCISCIGRQFLYHWTTWEAHEWGKILKMIYLIKG